MVTQYRSITEVLKLSHPQETLRRFSHISKSWNIATTSDELWNEYIEIAAFSAPFPHRVYISPIIRFRLLLESESSQMIIGSRVYSCAKQTFSPKMALPDSFMSSCLPLSADSVFVLSRWTGYRSKASFLCYSDDRGTVMLPEMLDSRVHSAMIGFAGAVYVFGGDELSISAEKLSLIDRKWIKLPNMLAQHRDFNAVRMMDSIYICGGQTIQCEIYWVAMDCFELLQFQLEFASPTLSFRANSEIIVMNGSSVYAICGERMEKRGQLKPEYWKMLITKSIVGVVEFGETVFISLIRKVSVQETTLREMMEDELPRKIEE